MIASSPSPALLSHSSRNASSAHSSLYSYAASKSPSPVIHALSSAFSHNPSPDPSAPATPAAISSSASSSSSSLRHRASPIYYRAATVDAATQVSPERAGGARSGSRASDRPVKRKEPSGSPDQPPPREPELAPQEQASTAGGAAAAEGAEQDAVSPSKRARGARATKKSMPAQYELCEVRDLVRLIAAMLMELIRFNDKIPLADGRLTRFHSRAPPGISVADYLQRLATHATLSPPLLLSMVYYIDRLCALYDRFTISSLTVHRFLIASATVASKGLSDLFWTNKTYARVGGITPKELKILELEFLTRMEWRIVPQPEVLAEYYRSLIARSDEYELESDDG